MKAKQIGGFVCEIFQYWIREMPVGFVGGSIEMGGKRH